MKNILCLLLMTMSLTSCYETHINPNVLPYSNNSKGYQFSLHISSDGTTNYYGVNGVNVGSTFTDNDAFIVPIDSCLLAVDYKNNGSLTTGSLEVYDVNGYIGHNSGSGDLVSSIGGRMTYNHNFYAGNRFLMHINTTGGSTEIDVKVLFGPCDNYNTAFFNNSAF